MSLTIEIKTGAFEVTGQSEEAIEINEQNGNIFTEQRQTSQSKPSGE
jgi:hypothetical protein